MPTVAEQLDYIVESGMKFGPFHKDEVFRLETDATYQKSFQDYGIKTCEFVLKRNGKLYFIEAKTSCPNYEAAATTEEKRKKYEEYIHDIAQKMRDSLNMYLSFLLNKNQVSDFPAEMKDFDWGNLQIRFVLVVKVAESEWLAPYQDVFREQLRSEMKIWDVPVFFAITEEMARKKRFLCPNE